MNEHTRAMLLALYAATVAAVALVERSHPLYRALCQLRAELERTCELNQNPTRRNAA